MEKVPLFTSKKEVLFFGSFLLIVFLISLGYEYSKFLHVKQYSIFSTQANVISINQKVSKNGKNYYSLKLQNDDMSFYTISWKKRDIKQGDLVKVLLFTKNITFYSYLKGFFAPSKGIYKLSISNQDFLHVKVINQHQNLWMQELYSALFFAKAYSNELREKITQWGISHLLAISGFHLGVLSAILFFLLKPLYRFFQDRYFPYRNSYADIAMIVFLLLGVYVEYIGVVPSVLRAYVMSLVGYFIFSRNIAFLSFSTLGVSLLLILAFFPKLLFSLGFWFSISGVFYIFLFLYHFGNLKNWQIFICLHFWVYILMMPLIHAFFDIFTWYQLFSPLLSMLFILFYPLSLFLHIVGFGGVLDVFLTKLLEVQMQVYFVHINLYLLLFYVSVSLLAIKFRSIAFLLPLISVLILFI